MTFEIKTDDGLTLGYAEQLSYLIEPNRIGGEVGTQVTSTPNMEITLNTFQSASPESGGDDALFHRQSRDSWMNLFYKTIGEKNEQIAELEAIAKARGKTIETLTDTFTAKKERIHAFYAPQLENRKQELKELELTKEFTHRETLSANKWCTRAYELEDELHAERLRANSLLDERRARPQVSVDHSVIAEYEEQIGQLGRKVERLQKSLSAAEAETYKQVDYKMHAWGRQVQLEQELKELQKKSDAFVEAHVRASHIINDSVVEWEDEA